MRAQTVLPSLRNSIRPVVSGRVVAVHLIRLRTGISISRQCLKPCQRKMKRRRTITNTISMRLIFKDSSTNLWCISSSTMKRRARSTDTRMMMPWLTGYSTRLTRSKSTAGAYTLNKTRTPSISDLILTYKSMLSGECVDEREVTTTIRSNLLKW